MMKFQGFKNEVFEKESKKLFTQKSSQMATLDFTTDSVLWREKTESQKAVWLHCFRLSKMIDSCLTIKINLCTKKASI